MGGEGSISWSREIRGWEKKRKVEENEKQMQIMGRLEIERTTRHWNVGTAMTGQSDRSVDKEGQMKALERDHTLTFWLTGAQEKAWVETWTDPTPTPTRLGLDSSRNDSHKVEILSASGCGLGTRRVTMWHYQYSTHTHTHICMYVCIGLDDRS